MTMPLAERAARTDAVVRRFRKKAFDWRKAATCIHLARAQAVAMGHRLPPVKRFQSPLAAKRVLAELGHADVIALLDAMFPGCRIPPAGMLVGDLCAVPGEAGLSAVFVCGGAKMFGWHQEAGDAFAVIALDRGEVEAAWRLGA